MRAAGPSTTAEGVAPPSRAETCVYYAVIAQCLVFFSALLILILLPISLAHTRKHRATVKAYAAYRRAHGAAEGDWPDRERESKLLLNPGIILTGSIMLVVLIVFGGLIEFFRPDPFHWMPGYVPLQPDPLLYWAILAGAVAAVLLGVWAWQRFQSPWYAVSDLIRRAVYAPADLREHLFQAALVVDPEMVAARDAAGSDSLAAAAADCTTES